MQPGWRASDGDAVWLLQADPAAPNPLIMGTAGVDGYLAIFANCQRAVHERLKDGAWQAW